MTKVQFTPSMFNKLSNIIKQINEINTLQGFTFENSNILGFELHLQFEELVITKGKSVQIENLIEEQVDIYNISYPNSKEIIFTINTIN